MIEIDLKNIWTILGEIIGETYTDELLDNLFRDFCVGNVKFMFTFFYINIEF